MTRAERVEMARKMTAARLAKQKRAGHKSRGTDATAAAAVLSNPPRTRHIKEPEGWIACKACRQSWANTTEARSDLADHWCPRAM
jgi:hypothetical protein